MSKDVVRIPPVVRKRKKRRAKAVSAHGAILSKSPYKLYLRFQGDLPKSANELLGASYRARSGNAQRWKALANFAAILFRPERLLDKFHISIKRSSFLMMDFDGCVSIAKPVIDGLKGVVIKDDSWAMTGPWKVGQEFRPKKEGPLLEVWISEREDLGSPN